MKSNFKEKTKKIVLILAILAILLVGGIFAYFTDIETADNEVIMGVVDIDLNEYEDANGTAWDDSHHTGVMPGDVVNKIVKINKTAQSANCYIRAKVEFGGDAAAAIGASALTLANGWTYNSTDGYYYYATELANTNPVEFFTAVTIPTTIDNTYALKNLTIKVTAEAIQSANFANNAPWTSVTIANYDVNP